MYKTKNVIRAEKVNFLLHHQSTSGEWRQVSQLPGTVCPGGPRLVS